MSKKLLSEAQVRRFQSLASITPLQELYREEEEEQNEMGHKKMEGAHDEGVYKEEPDENMEGVHEEEPMEKMLEEEEDDMDDDESDVELEEDLVERFMDAAKVIEEMAQALGGAAMDMGDDDDLDIKMDDKPEPPPMGDAPAPEGDEEEKDILELALEGVNYEPSQKEIVNEVAKRVAKRIMEAKKAKAKLDRALGNK